jgi:N-acetylglucosaminyldiphosphoundecaprenol N-acetyl-beta-D-mannosaminyltransferase
VGGTFDFLAGEVWRAPHMIRALHLEWLWRLLLQPWRLPRIFEATFVFLWMVLKKRLKSVR